VEKAIFRASSRRSTDHLTSLACQRQKSRNDTEHLDPPVAVFSGQYFPSPDELCSIYLINT